jgi:hypothetical protein
MLRVLPQADLLGERLASAEMNSLLTGSETLAVAKSPESNVLPKAQSSLKNARPPQIRISDGIVSMPLYFRWVSRKARPRTTRSPHRG